MNKPSDVSTISVNRHEKMEAFKSKSLWHPTTTEACDENNIFFPLYIRRKKKGKEMKKRLFFFFSPRQIYQTADRQMCWGAE